MITRYLLLGLVVVFMECIFCGEKDEGQLTLCTRVINGSIKQVDVCLGCWWHERAIWENRVENERRRQILSEQKEQSARAISDNNERQARIQPGD